MTKTLLTVFATIAFTLTATILANGQPPPKVKNNINHRIREITLYFTSPSYPSWEPAVWNYYIPRDAEKLKFVLDFNNSHTNVTARLELRQLCETVVRPDAGFRKELRYYKARPPFKGINVVPFGGIFSLEITLHSGPHPPPPPTNPHCSPDIDHLGEGPYEALIIPAQGAAPGQEPDLLGGDDTLRFNYIHDFESVTQSKFEILKSQEFLKTVKEFLERRTPTKQPRRRSSRRAP